MIEESGSLQEQVDETDQVVKTLQEFDSLIIIWVIVQKLDS